MAAVRLVPLAWVAVGACTVLTPLDDLTEGSSASTGSGAASSASGSGGGGGGGDGGSSTAGASSGGVGGGAGAGGASGGGGTSGGGGAAGATQLIVFGEVAGADVTGVTSDTMVEQMFPTNNYGATVSLKAEGDPLSSVLLRFDLQMLKPTVTVVAAKLHVSTTDNPLNAPMRVFEVLEAWEEGLLDTTPGISNYTTRAAPSTL